MKTVLLYCVLAYVIYRQFYQAQQLKDIEAKLPKNAPLDFNSIYTQ
ncbi:hypothetical protein BN8_01343 [Fibrisoma limi BUZ 3]|uniref:Uncharacterized protein n=1 Tax=Fibrisoma limi BUZ 3 TaxID=1185876 RepID=I2GEM2_9BACT|nr:hypothetical protein BN8_01343 [Fibrisoma limi BUZ 3]